MGTNGHRSYEGKGVAGLKTSEGAGAVGGYDKRTGQGAVVSRDKHGDVYVGRDDILYKRDDNNTWQKNSGSGWESVERSSPLISDRTRAEYEKGDRSSERLNSARADSAQRSSGRSSFESLNRDYSSRQRGERWSQTYNSRRSLGGGFRGRR